MIRDEHTDRTALQQIEIAHKLLMDSLGPVKSDCSDDEYEAYRAGVAQVLGHLFFLVMEPIYRQHPSLAPSDTSPEFINRWTRALEKREPETDRT